MIYLPLILFLCLLPLRYSYEVKHLSQKMVPRFRRGDFCEEGRTSV